jgi:hypothetical protein
MALGVVFLAGFAGCCQNEYREPGPDPPAPKNPPAAQKVASGPEEAPSGMDAAQGGGEVHYVGRVVLSAASGYKVPQGAVLFVMARSPGAEAPTPLAAKKFSDLSASSFPIAFELCEAESTGAGPLPARAELLARLDCDGDLATTDPRDLVADPVAASAGGPVELRLREPAR